MVFVSQNKFHKCKYCDLPAKVNYFGIKRKHKGYYRTCGSKECLNKRYSDKVVNWKKSYISKNIIVPCDHCKKNYVKHAFKQRWCIECSPNKSAMAILQRYNISYPEYCEMLKIVICPICLKNKPSVIDHCHKTGKVRGFICQGCNTQIHLVENPESLQRALIYLKQ